MRLFFLFAFRVVFLLRIGRLCETWKLTVSAETVGANLLLLRSQGPRGPTAIACPLSTPNQSLRTGSRDSNDSRHWNYPPNAPTVTVRQGRYRPKPPQHNPMSGSAFINHFRICVEIAARFLACAASSATGCRNSLSERSNARCQTGSG